MPLVLEPQTAKFNADGSGKPVTLNLINPTKRRYCFKIKSTNNDSYRVKPVFGFVDAGNQAPVELFRKNGAPGWDNFVVEWRGCTATENEPWAPFQRAEGRGPSGSKASGDEKECGQAIMPVQAR